jgi:(S)-mandelate dehydrogenase
MEPSSPRVCHASLSASAQMRRRAAAALPRFVFDYLEGGADDEGCIERNVASLKRLLLIPERLTDVERVQSETAFFSRSAALPIAIAPSGFNGLFWPQGDLALARAAAAFCIPFTLATAANSSIEEVSSVPNLNCWFQLYVFQDRAIAESLMRRAQRSGCGALLLTVDMPVSGNRLRDIRNKFNRHFSYRHVALDVMRRPRWAYRMLRSGKPRLANINIDGASQSAMSQARHLLANGVMDRALTWKNIEWVRKHWPGPIVLKGLLNPADAERARSAGVQGIVISNHGGRQLDSAPAAIDMLYATAQRVRKQMTVFVDGGFHGGGDIVKALALGAHGVLLGRALLYALAADGERGVNAVLHGLKGDIERTLALLGVARTEDLRPHHVAVERYVSPMAGHFSPPARAQQPVLSLV